MKNLKSSLIIAIATCISMALYAQTAAKVFVPEVFSSQATRMPVKGLNGFTINQKLTFGPYKTSAIKRGWDFSSGMQASRISFKPEDQVLKLFNIGSDNQRISEKNKFQFVIEDGKLTADVFALENFKEKSIIRTTNLPVLGDVQQLQQYDYRFSAAIVVQSADQPEPWQLLIAEKYDASIDRQDKAFGRLTGREEGYASNGKETILIKPLQLDNYTNKKGKEIDIWGDGLLSGYELSIDGGVIGVVDILDNAIWLYNDMDASLKLTLSAIGSAIMLKRKQDVQAE
jgi:hypothetical protein